MTQSHPHFVPLHEVPTSLTLFNLSQSPMTREQVVDTGSLAPESRLFEDFLVASVRKSDWGRHCRSKHLHNTQPPFLHDAPRSKRCHRVISDIGALQSHPALLKQPSSHGLQHRQHNPHQLPLLRQLTSQIPQPYLPALNREF